jgi:formate hydrogenlyase subunit 3/multisubunit Na+/H+ antiporter MnhD subunit
MGVIAARLGLALEVGDPSAGLEVAFYGAHHTLAKGALFLAVGAAESGRRVGSAVLLPAAVVGLGMAGLPLTGGALAKLAVKPVMDGGLPGLLGILSSAGTAMLMLHFLSLLPREQGRGGGNPLAFATWLAAAAAALLVPWMLYPCVGGSFSDALSPYALWSLLWPVLLGAGVWAGLRRAGRLPRARDGAVVVRGFRRAARLGLATGVAFERADTVLRRFAVALVALIAVAAALAALALAGV